MNVEEYTFPSLFCLHDLRVMLDQWSQLLCWARACLNLIQSFLILLMPWALQVFTRIWKFTAWNKSYFLGMSITEKQIHFICVPPWPPNSYWSHTVPVLITFTCCLSRPQHVSTIKWGNSDYPMGQWLVPTTSLCSFCFWQSTRQYSIASVKWEENMVGAINIIQIQLLSMYVDSISFHYLSLLFPRLVRLFISQVLDVF